MVMGTDTSLKNARAAKSTMVPSPNQPCSFCAPQAGIAIEKSSSVPQAKISAMLITWFFQNERLCATPQARFNATSSGRKMPLAVNSSSGIENQLSPPVMYVW